MATLSRSDLRGGSPSYPPFVYYAEITFGTGDAYATGGVSPPSGFPSDKLKQLSVAQPPVASPAIGGNVIWWTYDSANDKLVAYTDASLETELADATSLDGHVAKLLVLGW